MLLSRAALNFQLAGLRDGFENGVLALYGNAAPPVTANDALPGTLLGWVTKDGNAFTPGDPTNGLTFEMPAMGIMQKPTADVWKLTGIANGIATYGVFFPNAGDPGSADAADVRPRMIGKVGTVRGTLILSNTEITVGKVITVDDFTLDYPVQSLV